MSLALLRRTSGLVAMLCMAISLTLAVQTTAQAFEMADHAGHHFAEAGADHDDGDRETPSDPADKPDHHHTDHHSIGLVADLAVVKYAPSRRQAASPIPGMMHAGQACYGIERPPKA